MRVFSRRDYVYNTVRNLDLGGILKQRLEGTSRRAEIIVRYRGLARCWVLRRQRPQRRLCSSNRVHLSKSANNGSYGLAGC